MKKIKLIPALAMVAMLAACSGNKSVSVKAPKFAKEGKEVTYAEFVDGLNQDGLFGIFSKEDLQPSDIPSLEINYKESAESTLKINNANKKARLTSENKGVEETNIKADMKNVRIGIKGSEKGSSKSKFDGGESGESTVEQDETVFQYTRVDGEEVFMAADPINKTYQIFIFLL